MPGGLTEPPEDKLEGELPGWCQGAPPLVIRFDGGIDTFFAKYTETEYFQKNRIFAIVAIEFDFKFVFLLTSLISLVNSLSYFFDKMMCHHSGIVIMRIVEISEVSGALSRRIISTKSFFSFC